MVSSTVQLTREHREITILNSHIWHNMIPFKCSFLIWRALRIKFPTNERFCQFSITSIRCGCYLNSGRDNISHIFVKGPFLNHIWIYFSSTMGITHVFTSIKNLLRKWWNMKASNRAYKLVLQALPIIICWNLWKNRCAVKYGDKQP